MQMTRLGEFPRLRTLMKRLGCWVDVLFSRDLWSELLTNFLFDVLFLQLLHETSKLFRFKNDPSVRDFESRLLLMKAQLLAVQHVQVGVVHHAPHPQLCRQIRQKC